MPLFQLWNFPAIPARRVFPWKKKRHAGGAGSITCEFTLACEPKTQCTWDNTMKVNRIYRNVARKTRFKLRKHKESGGVGTARIFIEKHTLISPGWAGVTCKFWFEMKPRRILHEKTQRFLRGWREWHVNLESKWRPGAFFTRENTTMSPGLVADWGGVYITKEQRFTLLGLANMVDAPLKTYVFAYMFCRNADTVWHRLDSPRTAAKPKKKRLFTHHKKMCASL